MKQKAKIVTVFHYSTLISGENTSKSFSYVIVTRIAVYLLLLVEKNRTVSCTAQTSEKMKSILHRMFTNLKLVEDTPKVAI